MMRIIKAIGALGVLLAALIGAPLALWQLGSVPPLAQWVQAMRAPDDGTVLIGLLTVVGWLAWLIVALALMLELLALVSRQRIRITLPGLRWLHSSMGALVVSVLGPLAPALAAPPEPPPVTVSVPQQAEDESVSTVAAELGQSEASASTVVHRVQLGDDLWSLAEHYYQDGSQWRQIAASNAGVLSGGPDILQPGWELHIPQTVLVANGPSVHVGPGDSLSTLAAQHLGDASRWPELWQANRAVLADPDALPVGLLLRLPATAAAGEQVAQAADEPVVAEPEAQPDANKEAQPDTHPTDGPGGADEPAAPSAEPEAPRQHPAQPDLAAAASVDDGSTDAALLLGGIGGLLAAGLVGSFAARRLVQLHQRPVGRRVAHPDPAAQRLASALQLVQRPTGRETLAHVQRLVAQHCRDAALEPPVLDHVLLADDRTEVVVAGSMPPPPGFRGESGRWVLTDVGPRTAAVLPDPWPALVTVGRQADGAEVLIDLESAGHFGVDLGDAESDRAFARALVTELVTRPTAPSVVAVGIGRELVEAAATSHVQWADDIDLVLGDLTTRAVAQHAEPARGTARQLRQDADREEAWQPTLLVLDVELTAQQRRTLNDLIADPRSPVAVVRLGAPSASQIVGDAQSALLEPAGLTVAPVSVTAAVEATITELFVATETAATRPAPWWTGHTLAQSPAATITVSGPNQESPVAHTRIASSVTITAPMVRILGPIDLLNAAGSQPPRALKQCIEYCAWLLANPGRSSREMAEQLFVAETTRRSNMSRLRSWLGHAPDGSSYLPEAYSGRISLHEAVTSDWQLLGQLLPGDVRAAADGALQAALELVRGAPLADAAPQQWGWAEELRLDLVSMIRDAAVVLAERALERNDLELVRWAAARGLTAAPEDELLQIVRLRAEYQAGNHSEVDRISRRIVVRARTLDVDLLEETVDLLQEIAEGHVRARRAW